MPHRLVGAAATLCLMAAEAAAAASPPDYARDVQPILQRRCYGCHGGAAQMKGLRLDQRDSALRATAKIVPLITSTAALRMPPAPAASLPAAEAATLKAWIEAGAPWPANATGRPRPWSFTPVRKPPEPAAYKRGNPIDSFVHAKLGQKGIRPSPEADPRTLARRLFLDLTGLPPTLEQMEDYVAGARNAGAYERLVDQLLASRHFGEKWARHWLDLARYADSEGGVQDYGRPAAWRYREWVIDALNRDLPFDRFTVEQLAGDLLPGATIPQKIATGFQRQTITSREGGVEIARIRFEQLVDRTSTVGTVWLGLTMGCTQCHDHKYDPLTQRDFYRMMAFFENADETDLEAPLPGEWGVWRGYAGKFKAERAKLLDEYKIAGPLAEWEDGVRDAFAHPGKRPNWDVNYDTYSKAVDHGPRILFTKPGERNPREHDALVDYFVRSSVGAIGKEKYDALKLKELGEKLKKLDEQYPRLSTIMALAERDAGRREPTHVRLRGNWTDKGEAVTAGTPESLPPLQAGGGPADRLALARWLVSRDNPLTARVTVNRLWQELFGRGLVRTAEDFGAQGEAPSHPELLDWLAAEFMERGWSIKSLVRTIVTSGTYRQASAARPELATIDPANVLLARQSRFRLPAELIRDSALFAGGLLNDAAVGGESIRPPQPEGVADLQYSMKWEETKDRSRYRRGLYVFVQRTAAYPLLMNFDAPDRTVSCTRRETSNTPLQPLNLMNDPVFVEAAQGLAARVLAQPEEARAGYAFRLCLGREPNARERDLLLSYLARRSPAAQRNDEAAWFGASRGLLNSDEFLTRE